MSLSMLFNVHYASISYPIYLIFIIINIFIPKFSTAFLFRPRIRSHFISSHGFLIVEVLIFLMFFHCGSKGYFDLESVNLDEGTLLCADEGGLGGKLIFWKLMVFKL